MKISNARYITQEGYPFLEVDLDGKAFAISAEQKPTLSRHGIVSIPDSDFSAELPNGVTVEGAIANPDVFRLFLAFALDERNGREFRGGTLSPMEFDQIAEELEPYAIAGARAMVDYLP